MWLIQKIVLFHWSNDSGVIDLKMDELVLEEKSSFKMLGLSFSSKLDKGSFIISIVKTASKKLGASFYKISVFWGCPVSV